MSDIRKKANTITVIIACIILFGFSIANLKVLLLNVLPGIINGGRANLAQTLPQAEEAYQNNFKNRSDLIDIYGVSQNVLNRDIIGNFEYVRDAGGTLFRIFEAYYEVDIFEDGVKKLLKRTNEKGIGLAYIQAPSREIDTNDETILNFNYEDECEDVIVQRMRDLGILVMDERELIAAGDPEMVPGEIFFNTDLHMTTKSELWSAKHIAHYLVEYMGVPLNNLEWLDNYEDYFECSSYPMLGNFGRSIGHEYVGDDQFEIYLPKFDSFLELHKWDSGVGKMGDFQNAVLNGFEQGEYDKNTYWVTDYLCHGCPYYTMTNHMQETGSILVLADSIGYRTIGHLMLNAHEVTVLDPRFFDGVDYISQALNDRDYDAVIIYQQVYLTGHDFCLPD